MPELKTVLARQRQDYGISEAFQPQYPVEDQAANVDDTPVINIAMEWLCGKVDYRIHKLKELGAVSQSIILQQTEKLRKTNDISFREFTEEAKKIKDLKLSWSKKMKQRFEAGTLEKEAIAIDKEMKRLDLLDKLKAQGGPFTSREEVSHCRSLKNRQNNKAEKNENGGSICKGILHPSTQN